MKGTKTLAKHAKKGFAKVQELRETYTHKFVPVVIEAGDSHLTPCFPTNAQTMYCPPANYKSSFMEY